MGRAGGCGGGLAGKAGPVTEGVKPAGPTAAQREIS
jgi:hypothetical protein